MMAQNSEIKTGLNIGCFLSLLPFTKIYIQNFHVKTNCVFLSELFVLKNQEINKNSVLNYIKVQSYPSLVYSISYAAQQLVLCHNGDVLLRH